MAKDGKGSKDKEDDEDDEIVSFININGTRMPVRSIYTIKELDEYNFDYNCMNYFVLINEQLEGNKITVFSNIKIKCITEMARNIIIENIEEQMKENNCTFIKI